MLSLTTVWAGIRHFTRNLLRRARVERELGDEIDGYLELLIEEKVAQGMDPDAARRVARLEIGGMDRVKEEVRDVRAGAWFDALRQDVRIGIRSLLRRPGFALVAVLTLAVGIGATTAIFSLIDSVLLRPLPFPDADRLVMVWEVRPRFNQPRIQASSLNYLDWQEQAASFDALAAYTNEPANLTGDGRPERLAATRGTPNLLPMLGVEPIVGRWFVQPEGAPGQTGAVILSYGLWHRRFGGDPGIVGQTIRLDGDAHQVVGVMPRGFQFPREGVDVWIPVDYRAGEGVQTRGSLFLSVVGRLAPGVSLAQANAELEAVAERLARTYAENAEASAFAVPLQQDLVRNAHASFLLLLAAAMLVLLIACANVAGLLVTRGAERDREFAVRSALGASRIQLGRQLLVEGLLLSGVAAAIGLLLAVQTFDLLETLVPDALRGAVAPTLDVRLLGVALAMVVLTGIVFGLVPLRQALSLDLRTPLNEQKTITASGRRRAQALLVAGEVALAVVVLFSTGLMIRTIVNLQAVDTGFRTENVLTAGVALTATDYPTIDQQDAFHREVLDRVTGLPEVVSAGFTTFLPYTIRAGVGPLQVEGRPLLPGDGANSVLIRAVTADFLRTLGLPLVSGRHFSDQDRRGPAVAIVSERVRPLFDGAPLGQRVGFGAPGIPDMTVVGVVGDIKGEGIEVPNTLGTIYVPSTYFQEIGFFSPRSLAIRTTSHPLALADAVRREIWAVDPNQTIADVRTLESLVEAQLSDRKVQTALFTAFGGLALLMAALGVYGLLSFLVTSRTRELGVRAAIGAQRRDLIALIARDSVVWVVCGLVAGLALAAVVSRAMSSLVFGVAPLDWVSLAGAVCLLATVGVVAALRPVWRATRLDPATVLRAE